MAVVDGGAGGTLRTMILPILKYGAPELLRKSEPVTEFNRELKTLADNMLETMYAAPGVGLAAPQVGVNRRLIVIDIDHDGEEGGPFVLVNPTITDESGSQQSEEGCLSIPGFTARVERPGRVVVEARDLEGEPISLQGVDVLAVVLCHEIDHLDGILYLERISRIRREIIKRKIKKMMRAGTW